MRARSVRHGARGAAAVEFAIVLPVLLIVLLGTIDWGHYFFVRETIVHAAREGARAGTLVPPGADPTDDAEAAATDFITGASLDAALAVVDAGQGTGSVYVAIRYPVGSITGLLDDVLPVEATARAEMRR